MNAGKCFVLLLFLPLSILAQEEKQRNWTLNGYLKDMVSSYWVQDTSGRSETDTSVVDNLIHNRINFHWFPTDKLTIKLEARNRLLHGETVRFIPNYGENVADVYNDYFNLSYTWDNGNVVFHTMLDRAFMQWNEDTWELKVGRQRINWGVNLAWNPNDIFNAYSLFDFDYEERPGSDAVRFQRYIGYAGGVDIAVKFTDNMDDFTAGGMYKWNFENYDMQALAGIMRRNIALGGAWAGNIGLSGFKGEFTYFHALDSDDKSSFLGSMTWDYSFPNSLYFNASFLFNSYADEIQSGSGLRSEASLDVRYLSQSRWTTFIQSSYTFHPLINGAMMVLYYPEESSFFLGPVLTVSAMSNLDFDLISQVFFDDPGPDVYFLYGRVKFSF